MSEPIYPRVQRGDRRIPESLLNEHSQALEEMYGATAAGGGFDWGVFTAPPKPDETFVAQITAGDNSNPRKYSWVRWQDARTEGDADVDDVLQAEGGPGYLPAYELNSNTNVPIGSVVRMWWSWGGECLLFSWQPTVVLPASTPGSPTNKTVLTIDLTTITDLAIDFGLFLVYNQNNGHPYLVGPGFYFDLCTCTTTSVPQYCCEPGTCSYCADPPGEIGLLVSGFDGTCFPFNRYWLLVYSSACTWTQTALVGGVNVTATIVLAVDGYTLTLTDGTTTATYTAPAPSNQDCCAAISFTSADDPCPCGSVAAFAAGSCIACSELPTSISLTIAGCGGCLAELNGTWVLTNTFGCVYQNSASNLILTYATGSVQLQLNTLTGGRGVVYTGVQSNCCDAVTLNRALYIADSGTCGAAPASVTYTPACASSTAGLCPSTLTANPVCCGTVCDCSECSTGAQFGWKFTAASFTGNCSVLNGAWVLRWNSGCLWEGTLNGATAILGLAGGGATLTFRHSSFASEVTYTVGTWDCCEGATLNADSVGACTGNPATLVLSKCGDHCGPCVGGTGGPCCDCGAVPLQLTLVVAGFTSDTADCDANCTDLNGNWTLTLDTVTCQYDSGDAGTCYAASGPTWLLYCDGTDWLLTTASSAGSLVNIWKKSKATWNCLGSNTLALDTSAFCTGGIPATLTVVPV